MKTIIFELRRDNDTIGFITLEEATTYLDALEDKKLWVISELEVEVPTQEEIDEEIKKAENKLRLENLLKNNIQFGNELVNTFLLDNYKMPQKFTAEQSLLLLSKFENIIKLAGLGDISSIYQLLKNIEVDAIFSKERKDNYLQLIDNYLKSVKI